MRKLIILGCIGAVMGLFCIFRAVSGETPHIAQNQSSGDFGVYIDLAKISRIESSNNPKAYNKRSKATGLYQITPICLKEYNNFHKEKQYSMKDLYDKDINEAIAGWYLNVRISQMLRYYDKPDTIENRLIAYNV